MRKERVFLLPYPSTAMVNEPQIRTEGGDLLLSMSFDDEGEHRSARLKFFRQRAFRKRSESHCTAWHVKDTYDTLCEVLDSDWVEELQSASAANLGHKWVMHHFMIYVDSFGCLEVIAESADFEEAQS